jgi:hypothetical protein
MIVNKNTLHYTLAKIGYNGPDLAYDINCDKLDGCSYRRMVMLGAFLSLFSILSILSVSTALLNLIITPIMYFTVGVNETMLVFFTVTLVMGIPFGLISWFCWFVGQRKFYRKLSSWVETYRSRFINSITVLFSWVGDMKTTVTQSQYPHRSKKDGATPEKAPSFIMQSYRSYRDKVCTKVTF